MAISPTLSVENWSTLWCGLEWAYEGPVPAVSRESAFHGKCFRAWLLHDGACELEFSPRDLPGETLRIALTQGIWLLIPAGEGFQRFTGHADILSVSFTARWPTGEALLASAEPCEIPAARVPELQKQGSRLAKACGDHPLTPHHEFTHDHLPLKSLCGINARLYSWLGPFLDAALLAGWRIQLPGELDPRLATALRMVEERPLSQPLRVPELAESCGLSTSQLNRLFRHHYGHTPSMLFAERKKEYARREVRAGHLPLKEICYALGYTAPSHFTNWFRKQFGETPRAMRRRGL